MGIKGGKEERKKAMETACALDVNNHGTPSIRDSSLSEVLVPMPGAHHPRVGTGARKPLSCPALGPILQ